MTWLSYCAKDRPAQSIWHEIAKSMLICAFAIHLLRCAVCKVGMSACLKIIINARSICALHVVKSLLMLVDSDALMLMPSYFLLLTNRHALKPVFVF